MHLEGKTIAEIGELLATEFGESSVDFRMLAKDNFINGRVAMGMTSEDWIAIGLHRCVAAGVMQLTRSFMVVKPQAEDDAVGDTRQQTPISSITAMKHRIFMQDSSQECSTRSPTDDSNPKIWGAKLERAAVLRSVVRAEFPNYWTSKMKGPTAKRSKAKRTAIINKLFGVDCPLEERVEAEKEIANKLIAMRRNVTRHKQALEVAKELVRKYKMGSTRVDLFAYPKRLNGEDAEFFHELHLAKMCKPLQYSEVKVASGIVVDRIGAIEHPYTALKITVLEKYKTSRDYRLPFLKENPLVSDGHPLWVSQFSEQDTICWPEYSTNPPDEYLVENCTDDEEDEIRSVVVREPQPKRQKLLFSTETGILQGSPKPTQDGNDSLNQQSVVGGNGTWEYEPEIIPQSVEVPVAHRSPIPPQPIPCGIDIVEGSPGVGTPPTSTPPLTGVPPLTNTNVPEATAPMPNPQVVVAPAVIASLTSTDIATPLTSTPPLTGVPPLTTTNVPEATAPMPNPQVVVAPAVIASVTSTDVATLLSTNPPAVLTSTNLSLSDTTDNPAAAAPVVAPSTNTPAVASLPLINDSPSAATNTLPRVTVAPTSVPTQNGTTSEEELDNSEEENEDEDDNSGRSRSMVQATSPGQGRLPRLQRRYSRAQTHRIKEFAQERKVHTPSNASAKARSSAKSSSKAIASNKTVTNVAASSKSATTKAAAAASAARKESLEIAVEAKLQNLSVGDIKFLGGVLLKRNVYDVNLIAIKSYAATCNRSKGSKVFTITNGMKFAAAINHVLKRAIASGMLIIAPQAWDDNSFNLETVSVPE